MLNQQQLRPTSTKVRQLAEAGVDVIKLIDQDQMTMEEVQDEFTGLITPVVTDPKDEKMQPQVQILDRKKDDKGKPVVLRKYYLPSGANLEVKDNEKVHAGAVLAKIPREAARTKDITGETFRVDPDHDFLIRINITFDQGKMFMLVNIIGIDNGFEITSEM